MPVSDFELEKELFPLSLSQQNIWDLERSFSGTSINAISTTLRISGRVDYTLLQRALNLVLEADMSLRTRLTMHGGEVMQYHAPYERDSFPVLDFTMTDEAGLANWAVTLTREAMPIFDTPLYRFVLLRINEDMAGVFVKTHHIISDGWSQVQLCNRIGRTYLDLIAGREPELKQAPSYSMHVDTEREYLSSRSYEKDKSFWEEQLSGNCEPAALKSVKSAVISPVGARRTYHLPQTLNQAIYAYCREKRVAPFAVYYMALAIYLNRIGNSGKFAVGVPIFNRVNYTFKKITGMFVSTLPLYGQVDEQWSLDEFNRELTVQWLNVLRHQRFPFTHITKLTERSGALFNIVLSYQDSTILENEDTSVVFDGKWHYGGYQAEQLCIHLTNIEDNRKYCVDYDYLTQVFSSREIDELHGYICRILVSALKRPDRPIAELPLLGENEREQVLYSFNQTERYVRRSTPYQAFLRSVAAAPERAAVICRGVRTTYAELKELGARFACPLTEPGQLIAVLLPRGTQLIGAMIGIMQAGCAWTFISPDLPEIRIRTVLQDSGASAIISAKEYILRFGPFGLPVIDADELKESAQTAAETEREALAYVVYTSGSTGKPKGVEITGANLVNLAAGVEGIFSTGAVLSLSSIGFDVFVLESAAALLCGKTVLLPQDEELENPEALARLITGYGVRFMALTPSRLSEFLKYPLFRDAVRHMESIVCGGEAFPSELTQRVKLYTGAHIYNQYGPSETTVAVSYKEMGDTERITVGRPMPNCRFYVLDERMEPLPVGVYGQLYIGGACVGRGYRGMPELTQESFLPSPFEFGDTIYRSGDMACWTPEGEICIAGRSDRQVKVRGLRVELQEIASCLAGYAGVNDAYVRVWEQNGQSVIVGYYTSEKPLNEAKLLSHLGEYLPYYMVPACVIHVPSLPLGASGKVDERRLPPPQMNERRSAPVTELQNSILSVFRAVLGREDIHADSDYFLWGGTSLNAMETLGRLEDRLGVRLRVSTLHACRTARKLGEFLAGDGGETAQDAILPCEKRDFYPLSPMQRSIYFESHMDPTGVAYNMPGAFRLAGRPDIPRLARAFKELAACDDSLRTSFVPDSSGVVAVIADEIAVTLPILTGDTLEAVFADFLHPFDLAEAPLLRAALWEDKNGQWVLFIDMHHIICDGLSTPVLLERLDALYRGETAEAPLTFKDYACWREKQNTSDEDKSYWIDTLAPLPRPLDLPTDMPRPAVFDFRGGHYKFSIDARLTQLAEQYCAKYSITPFMFFAGAYALLLARMSGREELIIGSPVSARTRPELEKVCGPLIGTYPLRISAKGEPAAFWEGIRTAVFGMLDHRGVEMEDIISLLELPRSLAQNPLYQVLFSLRPLDDSSFRLGGEPLEALDVELNISKLDLSLEAVNRGENYEFVFEYASSLFKRETIELYSHCFTALVGSILSDDSHEMETLPLLAPADKMRYFDRPNRLRSPYLDMPVHKQIDEQAQLRSDEPAVIWHGETTTFLELRDRASRIAGLLAERGLRPGDRVALCCRRTPDMFACLMAILEVGGVYVPFLSSYPAARVIYMLENSQAKLVLCDDATLPELPQGMPCPAVSCSEAKQPFTGDFWPDGGDAIYILYTSGSTGQPKGVQLPHRAISNLLESMRELLDGLSGPVLCSTNMTFDIFITEGLLALAQGFGVVLADEEEMVLPWRLAELMTKYDTVITQFTPSRLQLCLGNEAFAAAAKVIKLVILVGEAVSPRLVEQFKSCSEGRFINMYGPTEAAVYVTQSELLAGESVTIGRPLKNCRIYVLNDRLESVPPTVVGELYLAGECLADGYVGRDDLTEKVFVPDPFFRGQRMYRSGDTGRVRSDGTLECLGRVESQIKINGNRVELGEISGAMVMGGAAEAVAVPVKNPDGSDSVVGIVSPESVDISAMKQKLTELLPPYMIPTRFIALAALPYNASGKIDLPLLKKTVVSPENVEQARDTGTDSENAGVTPEMLLKIWSAFLPNASALRADRSFFEQGGTSLGALNVLSEYFNRRLVMTLAQFYAEPTAQGQAKLLSGAEASAEPLTLGESLYPSHVPESLQREAERENVVLLTGATGYLGAHLLKSLVEHGAQRVVCLLRDGSRERLDDVLGWYFGSQWAKKHAGNIAVLRGDVTLERFGMDEGHYAALAAEIQAIYHSAADVRHYVEKGTSEAVNLVGTRNVIALALSANAMLYHVSTVSVAGDRLESDPTGSAAFEETDFDIGQNWADNIYVKTKFLAESEIYSAMRRGLRAKVFRIGRLVGRSEDGVFQKNPESNAFWLLARGVRLMRVLPASMAEMPSDLTPVDVCAEAILALRSKPMTVYHVVQPEPRPLKAVMGEIVPYLRVVPDASFSALLAKHSSEGNGEKLGPLINQWNSMRSAGGYIAVTAAKTHEQLKQCGFKWPNAPAALLLSAFNG